MAKKISNQGRPRKASHRFGWAAFSTAGEAPWAPPVWVAVTAVWTTDPVFSRIRPEPNWGRNGNRKLSNIRNQIKYFTLTEILVLKAVKSRLSKSTKMDVDKLVIHGGVSRNVVEDIANIELRPTFVSIVDDSALGQDVVRKLNNHKVNTEMCIRDRCRCIEELFRCSDWPEWYIIQQTVQLCRQ